MHSPFVFDFILNVLNNKCGYHPPVEIEALRKQLLADHRILVIEDLGAGSRSGTTRERTISSLARTALKPEKYASVLFRLVKHYQPATIIELGTSLGLTTAYLSKANPEADIATIEGSKAVAAEAGKNLCQLQCNSVQLYEGNFDQVLPVLLEKLPKTDLAYIDGNHRYEPTINYFHQFLEHSHEDTILIFDDIHWSREMEKAWEEIKTNPSVTCSIDIFFLGFVFFKSGFRVKQDFQIRF